jgi:acid phosphatase (class A)
MTPTRRRIVAGALAGGVALAGAGVKFLLDRELHYLPSDTTTFAALFPAPPAADSPDTRRELDELLELQRRRADAEVAAARADRKKDISRFYAALGFRPNSTPSLPKLQSLTDDVEADVGKYVRAPKQRFRRLRPYEIEPRLEPCIGDVQDDLSYPSGHATYGYVMAYLLIEFVPERRAALLARADEFARQRLVCGVHFPSDIEAGRTGARALIGMLHGSADFRRDATAAAAELRAALALPDAVRTDR